MFGYKHDCGSSMVKILGSDLKTRLSVFEKKYEKKLSDECLTTLIKPQALFFSENDVLGDFAR